MKTHIYHSKHAPNYCLARVTAPDTRVNGKSWSETMGGVILVPARPRGTQVEIIDDAVGITIEADSRTLVQGYIPSPASPVDARQVVSVDSLCHVCHLIYVFMKANNFKTPGEARRRLKELNK